MGHGEVLEIWTAPKAGADMQSQTQVRAIPGKGLEGDRYCDPGTFSTGKHAADQELTLIEIEQLQWFEQEHGLPFPASQTRRNILTRGISLNDYVGRTLRIGDVRLEGLRLCEPCATLQKRTGLPVLPAMVHRAGLNCRIVTGGDIRVGAVIEAIEPEANL